MAFGVTMGVFLTIAVLFWQQLPMLEKQSLISIIKDNFAYFFMAGVLLFTAFGFTVDWFFRFYIIPINQLAEDIQLKFTVNPDHIINISGSHDVMRLAEMIEQRVGRLGSDFPDELFLKQRPKVTAESEKDVLAALLEGLPLGIMVCNLDAKIGILQQQGKGDSQRPGGDPFNLDQPGAQYIRGCGRISCETCSGADRPEN